MQGSPLPSLESHQAGPWVVSFPTSWAFRLLLLIFRQLLPPQSSEMPRGTVFLF